MDDQALVGVEAALDAQMVRDQAGAWADRTRAGYGKDFALFVGWCAASGFCPLPASPGVVNEYLKQASRDHAAGTLGRWRAAIRYAHWAQKLPIPTDTVEAKIAWKALRNKMSIRPQQVAALKLDGLLKIVESLGDSLRDCRDKAMLLLGLFVGLRRSEIVALQVPALTFTEEGVTVLITKSKTDQEGAGEVEFVPRSGTNNCTVAALEAWLARAGISAGFVFRSVSRWGGVGDALTDQVVATTVKARAAAAGMDARRLSGHSLRRGMATVLALAGVSEAKIQKQGRWTDPRMVRHYVETARGFVDSPLKGVLL